MPAAPEPRKVYAFTEKGKMLECPKGLPPDAVLWCHDGDRQWRRADPAQPPRPAAKGRAAGPGLYDDERRVSR